MAVRYNPRSVALRIKALAVQMGGWDVARVDRIAAKLGISHRSLTRHLATLRSLGYLPPGPGRGNYVRKTG